VLVEPVAGACRGARGEIRDGQDVLDVGAGTGVLAVAIAEVTTSSRITGVDPAEDYVAHAAASARDPRIRFEVGDGQALPYGPASFDRTLSLLVMNFIPDPARALGEMIRVTRPGGLVAAAVWDYGDGMQMLRVFWEEAVALDPATSARAQARMPLRHQGELAALWTQHGLTAVHEQPLAISMRFASFDDYWKPFLLGQGAAGSYLKGRGDDQRAALRDRLRARLLGDGPDRPFELPARVWAVKGTVAR
jgi:SAM-dependent methyltransferase